MEGSDWYIVRQISLRKPKPLLKKVQRRTDLYLFRFLSMVMAHILTDLKQNLLLGGWVANSPNRFYRKWLRPNSWTKFRQQFSVLRVFPLHIFTVTATALPWEFYFFKLTLPPTVFRVQLLYTVKEKGGKPDRNPYPLPYGLRNPFRSLNSENSQDYAQKPQRNCTFMNLASGMMVTWYRKHHQSELHRIIPTRRSRRLPESEFSSIFTRRKYF